MGQAMRFGQHGLCCLVKALFCAIHIITQLVTSLTIKLQWLHLIAFVVELKDHGTLSSASLDTIMSAQQIFNVLFAATRRGSSAIPRQSSPSHCGRT
eukprot:2659958-Amphidinium_carterae.1